MTKLGFAFNFNIQRCEIEVGDEKRIIDEGYRPLLDLFVKYGLKADFFLSGFTSELLQKMDPELLEDIKHHVGKELELGTYTYTHPIPQLLIPKEFSMQMEKGMELDRSILGVETKGFLPPEFAFSQEMGEVLYDQGIDWFVALSSQVQKGLQKAGIVQDPYIPCKVDLGSGKSLLVVPAIYQLPDTPQRFFKLMMKGLLPVDTVIEGIKKFAELHPDGVLLLKRDGETIFIDKFNSGFEGTLAVMDEFIEKISKLDIVEPIWISEALSSREALAVISLPDYLGNTNIETFTSGAAQAIWDLTQEVRNKILEAEKAGKDPAIIKKAWEYLMLSHNSDGRIGYWFSEWNPGEHTVAPGRRQFVEDNLQAALNLLN
ncbi:polysaccharide deacetylase family protein [uncultured Sphaerochaeta sp.]|uniref:polysaccharide deacetylase family protein n=1 Tax=uncultured Sphaerochaeta sp. TaxID=886478 RepID=UPI002A0A2F11|nr:polysaccharide deacetylase family protein [uncultured Sphaerochaeta sp.]